MNTTQQLNSSPEEYARDVEYRMSEKAVQGHEHFAVTLIGYGKGHLEVVTYNLPCATTEALKGVLRCALHLIEQGEADSPES